MKDKDTLQYVGFTLLISIAMVIIFALVLELTKAKTELRKAEGFISVLIVDRNKQGVTTNAPPSVRETNHRQSMSQSPRNKVTDDRQIEPARE